jgi:hypothetical protein
VPNGALLVENTLPLASLDRLRLRRAGGFSVLGRISELMVQRLRARAGGVGTVIQSAKRAVGRMAGALEVNRSTVGDIGFNLADVDLAMSAASERLLKRFDFAAIRATRAANYHALTRALGAAISPACDRLPDGACPLFLPIVVDDKPAAARALTAHGIEALEFWNQGANPLAQDSEVVRYLRSHVLGLPVHQDLTARQLAHMAEHFTLAHRQAA